jgi:Zn-dependent M28 family amino/carboxypeptidase
LSAGETALAQRLRTHVEAIARRPHNVRYFRALEQAANHIEATLVGFGYEVRRQPFASEWATVRNIEVVVEPARTDAPTIVVGAHYDSAGSAPGANDNGSGTAAVLELARSLADLRGKAPVRMRLVLFVNEEPPFFQTPLMGSMVYARRLAASGERVEGMLSLETMGYYSDAANSQHYPAPLGLLYPSRGDFIAFVGDTGARSLLRKTIGAFRARAAFPSIGGTAPGAVQGIGWSDHWAFGKVGIPALMVTDTAPFRYPHYHTDADTPDKLDYPRLARVVGGLEQVLRNWTPAD